MRSHRTDRAARRLVVVILLLVLLPLAQLAGPATPTAQAATPISLKFDFGSATSPVESGYLQVANTMLYSPERGYGLSNATDFRDRGAPDALRRDFVISGSAFGFSADLPNGEYFVRIITGDQIASNRTSATVEGVSLGSISTATAQFGELSRAVMVGDGQLNVTFGDNRRVNAIEIFAITTPTGLRLEQKTLSASPAVTLAWDAVDGAASYRVYRAPEGTGSFSPVGEASVPSYTDTSVDLGLSYVYAVTQVTGAGIESGLSEPLAVAVLDPAVARPNAPAGLRLEAALRDSTSIAWDSASGALLYYVYGASAPEGPFTKLATTTETSYVDSATPTGAQHYYQVVAANAGGLAAPSTTLKAPIVGFSLRQAERLDRGLVAVTVEDGVLVSWRLLATDPQRVAFNLYRDGQLLNPAPLDASTNYLDASGGASASYSVRPVLDGVEGAASAPVGVWANSYRDIPLQKPASGVTPSGESYTYRANDASVADLDGDGQYELVLKWDPSNSKDNSQSGYTGEVFLDAYELDGTQLWRIAMGRNIRAGAHYTQFLVYDFDGDGRAEVVAKTADGTTDGVGTVIGNPSADYRNSSGYILSGPEFLTVFDGQNGAALATTNYYPPRGNVGSWGDTYGNRVDRFLAGVAYLDGERPSFVMARGYYTRTVLAAYNYRDGAISQVWVFDTNQPGLSSYTGQGNHSLAVGDVDGDGRDEITYGAMAVDHDGSPLYTTRLGHGDAHHLSDLDPSRPGLEYFQVHETASAQYGLELRDARTGAILWGQYTGRDTGRGLSADIDPRHLGAEAWAVGGEWNSPTGTLRTVKGEPIGTSIPPANFAIWWDGDLLRELLDHSYSDALGAGTGTITKWDWTSNSLVNLLSADGTLSNNSTKGNPSLQADLLGDWREEVLWRTADSSALRLFTTPYLAEQRLITLMHDPVYRLSVAWQNVGYNQPPHVSYYLGVGMQAPARPLLQTGTVIPATLAVDPETFNVRQAGPRYATLYVELPAGYALADVEASSLQLFADGVLIPVEANPLGMGDADGDGVPDLMVKVDGRALSNALRPYPGVVELSLIGYLSDGTTFVGADTVRVIN